MPDLLGLTDYEQLALAELDAAARSQSGEQRNAHLNRAAVFAAKNEAHAATERIISSDRAVDGGNVRRHARRLRR